MEKSAYKPFLNFLFLMKYLTFSLLLDKPVDLINQIKKAGMKVIKLYWYW